MYKLATLISSWVVFSFFALSPLAQAVHAADFWTPLNLKLFEYQESANERRIAHITSDAMDGWTDFLIDLGPKSEIQSFRLATRSGSAIEFNLEHLREGAVVKTDRGVSGEELHTLTLQSDDFNPLSGGMIKLIYLVNGAPFFQKYDEFETRLRLKENGQWTFESGNNGRPFNSIFLKSNHMFGKVVGIERVEVSWNGEVKYDL